MQADDTKVAETISDSRTDNGTVLVTGATGFIAGK